MKVWIISLICLLVLGIGIGVYYSTYNQSQDNFIMEKEIKQFQGPIPEGYDEEYFRETGITKKIGE